MADTRYKFVHSERSHIWRIGDKERDNGRMTHRQEAEKLIGRKVHTQSGDVLGLILRKEREGHVPEHLLVEPYFGSKVPRELLDYLEKHFPGAQAIVSHHSHSEPKEPKKANWTPEQPKLDAAEWARVNLPAAVETGWFDKIKGLF